MTASARVPMLQLIRSGPLQRHARMTIVGWSTIYATAHLAR
jgi:hypothetical protein